MRPPDTGGQSPQERVYTQQGDWTFFPAPVATAIGERLLGGKQQQKCRLCTRRLCAFAGADESIHAQRICCNPAFSIHDWCSWQWQTSKTSAVKQSIVRTSMWTRVWHHCDSACPVACSRTLRSHSMLCTFTCGAGSIIAGWPPKASFARMSQI